MVASAEGKVKGRRRKNEKCIKGGVALCCIEGSSMPYLLCKTHQKEGRNKQNNFLLSMCWDSALQINALLVEISVLVSPFFCEMLQRKQIKDCQLSGKIYWWHHNDFIMVSRWANRLIICSGKNTHYEHARRCRVNPFFSTPCFESCYCSLSHSSVLY